MFIGFLVVVNTIIAGGARARLPLADAHVIFHLPILGTPISAESISLAVTQFMRYMAMATIGFPVAFAVAPNDFGIAFRRLGVPEKFAFAIDLTFRFLPSLAADFQTTDRRAARSAGTTVGRRAAGSIGAVRRSGPVDRARPSSTRSPAPRTRSTRWTCAAFGTGKRTWLRELAFDRTDWLVLLVVRAGILRRRLTVARVHGDPSRISGRRQFLIDLAGGSLRPDASPLSWPRRTPVGRSVVEARVIRSRSRSVGRLDGTAPPGVAQLGVGGLCSSTRRSGSTSSVQPSWRRFGR